MVSIHSLGENRVIRKVIRIRNVARFEDCLPPGNVELRPMTVIYSDNGRGKTVLSAILRSLKTGDGRVIEERRTLGAPGTPEVLLRLDSQNATYSSGQWDTTLTDLEVFDRTFVYENVCSGTDVDSDHRKGLYAFTIGQDGVKLMNQVEALAAKIRDVRLGDAEKEVRRFSGSMRVDDFLALATPEDVDKQIADQEREVDTLEQAEAVARVLPLDPLSLPTVEIDEVRAVLQQSLEELSNDAKKRVREHVSTHLGPSGEEWLHTGVGFAGETCPFCGQSLAGIELVSAYRVYFSDSYGELKETIAREIARLSHELSVGADVLDCVQRNVTNGAFWSKQVGCVAPSISAKSILEAFEAFKAAIVASLERKARAPLTPVDLEADVNTTWTGLQEVMTLADSYNLEVSRFNEQISLLKKKAATKSLDTARVEREALKLTKTRSTPEAKAACESLTRLRTLKSELEEQKSGLREKLDAHTNAVFEKYQKAIDRLLVQFGVEFSIRGFRTSFAGGTPRSEYEIEINDKSVPLSAPSSGAAAACFRNTLSEGDKASLAFAFFLARLQEDPDLGSKVIVLDDPISSLDANRRSNTAHQIVELARLCCQVIVLTHDPHFARELGTRFGTDTKFLGIMRSAGHQSTLSEWDVTKATRSQYLKDHFTLLDYVVDCKGEVMAVVRAIRPLVEENLRMRFPSELSGKAMLGEIVGAIASARQGDTLYGLTACLKELTDINDFSKKYHHGESSYQGPPPSDQELRSYSERALTFVRGA